MQSLLYLVYSTHHTCLRNMSIKPQNYDLQELTTDPQWFRPNSNYEWQFQYNFNGAQFQWSEFTGTTQLLPYIRVQKQTMSRAATQSAKYLLPKQYGLDTMCSPNMMSNTEENLVNKTRYRSCDLFKPWWNIWEHWSTSVFIHAMLISLLLVNFPRLKTKYPGGRMRLRD